MMQSAGYYWVECDTEGCDARCPPIDREITAWSDEYGAAECALDSGWVTNGVLWHCEECDPFCGCGAPAGPLSGERDHLCQACWDKGAS